jgi:hypothetical protein
MKFPTLRQSILSTPKQRKRFFWLRNMAALGTGALAYQLQAPFGLWLCLPITLLAYFTVAPIVAVILCFIEEMLS